MIQQGRLTGQCRWRGQGLVVGIAYRVNVQKGAVVAKSDRSTTPQPTNPVMGLLATLCIGVGQEHFQLVNFPIGNRREVGDLKRRVSPFQLP